jgi:glutaconyl-CoA/methylmalonyl-CoA decarboxylase subunit gamma
MRVTLEVDGKPMDVEVDLEAGTVRIGERSFPAKVVADTPRRVELEIGGEKVVVEGWGVGEPTPPDAVAVDGERFRVRASVAEAGARPPRAIPPPGAAPTAVPSSTVADGVGTAIAPPMPGKVVELRVREGETVKAGQVLLVLEAMKMRNEVTTPIAGVVRSLRVSAGANVRAREPMLRIEPA